jgi:hypothetical protein
MASGRRQRSARRHSGSDRCCPYWLLEKRFGAQRLETAAVRALEIQARNYPSIKSILEKGLDQVPVPQSPEQKPIIHSTIRGSSYYN